MIEYLYPTRVTRGERSPIEISRDDQTEGKHRVRPWDCPIGFYVNRNVDVPCHPTNPQTLVTDSAKRAAGKAGARESYAHAWDSLTMNRAPLFGSLSFFNPEALSNSGDLRP